MSKVLLFGSSGNIGKSIAAALKESSYELTVVVRNEQKAKTLSALTSQYVLADVTSPETIQGICNGVDIVISALGKSVSPVDKSKASFRDVDFKANVHILQEALKSGVGKFVYVSVFHAEKYPALEYFRSHFDFETELKSSGIDYTIVRPPAVFSSFIDLINMSKKGRLVTIGRGDKRTNPIYEGDLAKIIVAGIGQSNSIIEAGGKQVLTRKEINELIHSNVNPEKKLRSIPLGIFKTILPLIKLLDRNSYDKFAFFLAVMQEDIIAPQLGETSLADYLKKKLSES